MRRPANRLVCTESTMSQQVDVYTVRGEHAELSSRADQLPGHRLCLRCCRQSAWDSRREEEVITRRSLSNPGGRRTVRRERKN